MLSPEWSAVIVAVVASPTLTAITNAILTVLKRKKKKKTPEQKAMIVLLRRELRELYNEIKANNYVTIDELEEFDEIYEVYHDLGGNGRGTKMYDYVHNMKMKG